MKRLMKLSIFLIVISLLCISCTKKDSVKKIDNNTINKKEEVEPDSKTDDVDIKNDCENLTSSKAQAIIKEIQEIMISTYKDIIRLDNFTINFSDEKENKGKIIIDITVESDWTSIRKPEDNPIIVGMNSLLDELETDAEKKAAKEIINGFLKEMEAEYNTTERQSTYLQVEFTDKDDLNYELFYPEVLDGKTTLYPMRDYFIKNFKENAKERENLGKTTLKERLSQ